jgi:DNA-binding response OmpR family regulator
VSAAEALTGDQGSLLAVVPVNGGSSRLAIVGYIVPVANEDGDAREDTSARLGGASGGAPSASKAAADGLVVDIAGYRVLVGGQDAGLVLREFELLAFLAANPGQAFPRAHLLATVWGDAYQGTARTVDVHIHRLRRKLGPAYAHRLVTVRRVGYMYHPTRDDGPSSPHH